MTKAKSTRDLSDPKYRHCPAHFKSKHYPKPEAMVVIVVQHEVVAGEN
jgi:hypothetical protein